MTAERVAEGVWRLPLASNTLPPFDTTNTYLIADNGVAALVDPGFEGQAELEELRSLAGRLGVRLMKSVLLSHTHSDHTAGLPLVRDEFDDPAVYLHPNEIDRLTGVPVQGLADGRVLTVGDLTVSAIHTPGHSPGHLCFHLPERGVLLAGDLVAGGASVWVGLPEGDMVDYLASLEKVLRLSRIETLGPGHGQLIRDPRARLEEARRHRLEREAQVVAALNEPRGLDELRDAVYGALPEQLKTAAQATLLAHLRKLMGELRVMHLGEDESGPFVVRR